MYETFYGLSEKPFALTPDPAYLYLGRRHRQVLVSLEYALAEASGFALVTGEVGCGKTTIVRHLLERADRDLNIGLVCNTHANFGALLPWVMDALGVESAAGSPSELHRRFVAHLKREHAAGHRSVLVIDEAQNLDVAALEELRVLSNLNIGKDVFLQTILIGQPELRATLRLPALRQFAQRIAVDHHLESLGRKETHEYVQHRLSVAGGRSDLISPDAVDLVHEWAAGVPRLVNLVCDTALVYGFADQTPTVDSAIVEQVLQDREQGGLLPRPVPASAPPPDPLVVG
ncbi:MAG: AAA family ATPase [Gammaproteobacteria bacterium]